MVGTSIKQNKLKIEKAIRAACAAAGRNESSVRVLAVSKGQSVDAIRAAQMEGLKLFGENYVQEWAEKASQLKNVSWHFIGHLQSNKVKQIVGQVALIHSVDRDSLAQSIANRAVQLKIQQPILVEVNIAGERSKTGISPEHVETFLKTWATHPGLRFEGLMIMPPMSDDPEASRPHFRTAAKLLHAWRPLALGHPWRELSMGTSQDYPVAVEEGATLVRLGTVLFGPRP